MDLTRYKLVVTTVALCMISALTSFGKSPQSTEVHKLPPSRTLEREISGAETHRYKFD